LTTEGKLSPSATIGEEAVVATPLEAPRDNVHQEAPNELLGGEGDGLALVVVPIVLKKLALPSSMPSKRSCFAAFAANRFYDHANSEGRGRFRPPDIG
jgi:hypothetical protein